MTRLHLALHRLLRWVLPARIRRLRGSDMDATFLQMLRHKRGGWRGGLVLWISEAPDLLRTGVQLRWRAAGRGGLPIGRGATATAGDPTSSGRTPFDPNRRFNPLDTLLLDLRFALRGMRRNPGFAAVAILTLALGIGASTAAFSIIDAVLLRPLPYDDPDGIVTLWQVRYNRRGERIGQVAISAGSFLDLQERNRVFTRLEPISWYVGNLTGGDAPQRINAWRVSSGFFEILGVEAALGRAFRPEEDARDVARVVLSHDLWQRAFGGDPGVVGRVVHLDETPFTVVGIMPRGWWASSPNLWMNAPLPPNARIVSQQRELRVDAIARLRPGVTLEQARAEMETIAAALVQENPDAPWRGARVIIRTLHQDMVKGSRPSLLMQTGAAGFVLLIACVNVANLLLARSAARQPEIALRVAIGSGRSRLARQFMTEGTVLAVLGGVAGSLLARAGVTWFLAFASSPEAGWSANLALLLDRVAVDARALAVALLLSLAIGVVCGLLSSVRATTVSPASGLQVGRGAARRGKQLLGRQLLVAVEVALALVLLIGLGLLLATFSRLYEIPLGFDPENIQTMRVELSRGKYAVEDSSPSGRQDTWTVRPERALLVRAVVERLEALPSVHVAAAGNRLPFHDRSGASNSGAAHVVGREPSDWIVEGIAATKDESGQPQLAMFQTVTPGYFSSMRIPLLAGREFSWSDDESARRVAIVSRDLADEYWPGEDPIGRVVRVRFGREWRSVEIVGLVDEVWLHGFGLDWVGYDRILPGWLYLPSSQTAPAYSGLQIDSYCTSVHFVARHDGDGQDVATAMREIIRELEPDAPVTTLESMESSIAANLADRRFFALLIGGLSTICLVLALIGVYGVMAFQVSQRVHEIGVRMAIGARAGEVVRMIVGDGLRVALLGALLGVLGAMAATRLLSSWLYEVSATDPLVFTALAIVMVGVGALACWVPARRAARVDPATSLRAE